MRIVLDSNVVISGFLWEGAPRRLIGAAIDERVTLITSTVLLVEIERVAGRKKFAEKLTFYGLTPGLLAARFAALAEIVVPAEIGTVVTKDPDDDHVLAAALGGNAEIIVSGDADLLNLKRYHGISIISPTESMRRISLVE